MKQQENRGVLRQKPRRKERRNAGSGVDDSYLRRSKSNSGQAKVEAEKR